MAEKSDDEVVKIFTKQKKAALRKLDAQYTNTDICRSYYDNDIDGYTDKVQFADETGRKRVASVQFPKAQANVDAVVGFMAQNRRQAKFSARVPMTDPQSDMQANYSKFMNALYGFHRDYENADQVETEQDADMMICGYGATETDLSYITGHASTSPLGNIIKIKLDPKTVYWDATKKDKNLLGSTFCGYHTDYALTDALDLFQDSEKEDFEPVDAEDDEKGAYHYNPYGGVYDKIKEADSVEWVNAEDETVRVYNHQWMEYETYYRAENPLYTVNDPQLALFIQARLEIIKSQIKPYTFDNIPSQDSFDFDPTAEEFTFDEETKNILVKEFGDQIDPVAFKRKVYYTAVISGKHVFKCFRSVSQQGFSIKFKTGIYNETQKIWTGIVNSMMEPIKYFGKALTELLFSIAANSKGGVMVEEGAVEDISDFESKWAKTDAVIKVASGAISGQMILQKAQGAVPTGLEGIMQIADQSISSAGVDPSFIGNQADNEESGILYRRRIRQVVSKMARYFDSITLYQKEDARLHADLIPVWVQNNNGQYIRITGEQGKEEFLKVSEDKLAPDYDVSIQEAPQTPEDKQIMANALGTTALAMMQVNPQAGQVIMNESLMLLPLDSDAKKRISDVLQPNQEMVPAAQAQQQIQELQAQLQELQGQLNQSQVQLMNSQAALNDAKISTEKAKTAQALEEANRTHLENHIVQSGGYTDAKVSI